MHSLSLTGISAELESVLRWQPTKAGIELNSVPNAPLPAESAPRRLLQMRTLAGGFSAQLKETDQHCATGTLRGPLSPGD